MSNNISNDFFNPFDTTSEQISQNQVGTSDAGDADFIVSEGFARAADSVSTISATKNLDKIQIVGKDGIQVSLSSVSNTTAKFTISAPSFVLGQVQLDSGLTVNTGTTGRLAYYSTASSIGASSQNLTYDVNSGTLSYDTANLASLINLQDSNSNKGIRFNYSSGNPSKIYADTGTLVLESQISKITLAASAASGIQFDNTFLTSQYGIVIENPSLWHDINSKDVSLKISAPAQSIPLAIGTSDFFVDIGSSLGDVKVGIGTNTPTHELQVIGNVSASVYYGDGSNLTGITTAPAGNNTEIQFNNAGAFGASSDFVWNDISKQLTINGDVSASVFYGDGSSLTNLPAPGIQNVVEDTTPQLGGNLDMNGNIVASSFEVSGAFDLHGPTTPGQESNPTWRPRVLSSNGALVLQGGQNTSTNITIAGGNITHAGNLLAYGVYNQVRLQDGNSGGRFRIFEANSGRERMEMHAFDKYTNFYVHQASPYVFRIVDGSGSSDVGNDYLTISGSNQSIAISGSSFQVTSSLDLSGSSHHITGSINATGNLTASGHVSASAFYGDGSALTNLPAGGISSVVEDTTPQLGGDLDLNGNDIHSVLDANGTGSLNIFTDGTAERPYLAFSATSGSVKTKTISLASGIEPGASASSASLTLIGSDSAFPGIATLTSSTLTTIEGGNVRLNTTTTATGYSVFSDSLYVDGNTKLGSLSNHNVQITGSLETRSAQGPIFYATNLSSTDKFFFQSDSIGDELSLSITRGGNTVDLIGVIDDNGTPVSHFAETIYQRSGKIGIKTDTNTTYDLMVNGTTRLAGDTNITGDSNGTLTIARSATSPTGSLIISGSDTSRYGDDDIIIYNYAPGIRFVDRTTNVTNFRLGVQENYFALSIDTDQDQDTIDFWGDFDDYSTAILVDNAGNVGINNSAGASYRLDVREETSVFDANKYVARFWNDGNDANAFGIIVQCGQDASTSLDKAIVYFDARDGDGDSTGQLGVNTSGVFSLQDISDERLKENIRKTEIRALDMIKETGIYDYEWKKTGVTRKCGFVAQDLEKQYPEAVSEYEKEDGEKIKMVSESMLIPVLTKAIQEQQEMIDKLIRRVEELENK